MLRCFCLVRKGRDSNCAAIAGRPFRISIFSPRNPVQVSNAVLDNAADLRSIFCVISCIGIYFVYMYMTQKKAELLTLPRKLTYKRGIDIARIGFDPHSSFPSFSLGCNQKQLGTKLYSAILCSTPRGRIASATSRIAQKASYITYDASLFLLGAEREGFEPRSLSAHRFSRPAHSTTLPPFRVQKYNKNSNRQIFPGLFSSRNANMCIPGLPDAYLPPPEDTESSLSIVLLMLLTSALRLPKRHEIPNDMLVARQLYPREVM